MRPEGLKPCKLADKGEDPSLASFKCKDIGLQCKFEVKNASSKEEVMKLVTIHTRETHRMETVPEDLSSKIMTKIKDWVTRIWSNRLPVSILRFWGKILTRAICWGSSDMKCPRCKSGQLNEDQTRVICMKCGFTATLREYRLWRKVSRAQPWKREKIVFQDNENGEAYSEVYTTVVKLIHDRRAQGLIVFLILLMALLVIATTTVWNPASRFRYRHSSMRLHRTLQQ